MLWFGSKQSPNPLLSKAEKMNPIPFFDNRTNYFRQRKHCGSYLSGIHLIWHLNKLLVMENKRINRSGQSLG